MKNLKTTLAIFAITGLTLTSCMDEKKSSENNTDAEEMNTEMNSEMDNQKNSDMKNNVKETKTFDSNGKELMAVNYEMKSKDGKVVSRSDKNEVHAMQISGWESFNTLSIEMKKLEGADFATMKATLPNFSNTIATLNTTRPEWMMTEEISEDIEDVQKEYKELMSKDNTNDKKYKRDLEELNEAYDDLVEEINETFEKYVEINREANEEYREEAKDGEMEDAREEYNEEIKKLNKVADDKK